MIDEQKMVRVFAWLIRNEGVEPEAIERAVGSAMDMRLGEAASLTGVGAPLRRAFCQEQAIRLARR